jgi:serine/threonine protein kinase
MTSQPQAKRLPKPSAGMAGVLLTGTPLMEYEVRRVLGRPGGFGVTYLAVDTKLLHEVAIKEYLPVEFAVRNPDGRIAVRSAEDATAFEWGMRSFLNEARVLARCRHPGVVQAFRFFELNDTAYMVLEYVQGHTLADELAAGRRFDQAEVERLLLPLLEGLGVVHEAGVLHRDLKPENIMRRVDDSPVLIDFGAARTAIGQRSRSLMSVLTGGYAPIEQYSQNGKQGPWTDIYALGAVVYRALTGRKPPDVIDRLDSDPLVPLEQLPPMGLDPNFLHAIDWALQVAPERRPQSIDQWRRALLGERDLATSAAEPPLFTSVFNLVDGDSESRGHPLRAEPLSVLRKTGLYLRGLRDVPGGAPPAAPADASVREPQAAGEGEPTKPIPPATPAAPAPPPASPNPIVFPSSAATTRPHELRTPPRRATRAAPRRRRWPRWALGIAMLVIAGFLAGGNLGWREWVAVATRAVDQSSPQPSPKPAPPPATGDHAPRLSMTETLHAPAAPPRDVAADAPMAPIPLPPNATGAEPPPKFAPPPPAPAAASRVPAPPPAPRPSAPAAAPDVAIAAPAAFEDLLDGQNRWRADAGVGALRWSQSRADEAQRRVEQLSSRGCAAPADVRSGEAVFADAASSTRHGWRETPARVVERWSRGRFDYDREAARCLVPADGCPTFAQMVAPNARYVGCSRALCDTAGIWVCSYSPPLAAKAARR